MANKARNSSIELYRIMATLTVIIAHFNGWFVGDIPNNGSISELSIPQIMQILIAAFTSICVNMFLLISGYFGIKLKLESLLKIVLLLLFIKVPFYFCEIIYGETFSTISFIGRFFVITQAGYFVQCYLMLMFLSPVLNSFIEKYDKKVLTWTIFFLLIEFWLGCIMDVENLGFNDGYSVIHFVLMYMVGRCIYLYKDVLVSIQRYMYWGGHILLSILIFFLFFLHLKWSFAYSNPLVVISSICTFVPYLYKDYYNKRLNWIASSTFAVYILQVTHPIFEILTKTDQFLKESFSYPVYWILGICVIIVFFAFSVIYDKLCSLFIKPIVNTVTHYKNGKYNFSFK